MAAATYRLGQGFRALFAFALPLDLSLARVHLTDAEFAAFRAMTRSEQSHSLNVLRALLAKGESTPKPLAAAALTHDVGKSRYRQAVWQRTLYVLVSRLAPGLAQRLAEGERLNPLRAPFIVSAKHARWSGEILNDCGSHPLAIWLAENHAAQATAEMSVMRRELLLRLQAADDAN